jgi:hypothetical protein
VSYLETRISLYMQPSHWEKNSSGQHNMTGLNPEKATDTGL